MIVKQCVQTQISDDYLYRMIVKQYVQTQISDDYLYIVNALSIGYFFDF